MIEFAEKRDIAELTALWQTVFDEDKEVCEIFFESVFPLSRALIYRENGEIVSSLFLLNCSLGEFAGLCIYCAMTRSDFRGKGYMKKLLSFADGYRKEKQLDFLFLVPAEESLFEYYKKCGFEKFGNKQTAKVVDFAESSLDISSCSPEEYIFKRESLLRDTAKLTLPAETVKYWVESCYRYGGEAVYTDGACGLIFSDAEETSIRDLVGSEEGISRILLYAKRKYSGNSLNADGRNLSFLKNFKAVPAAMVKTENKEIIKDNYYIGITLE